MLTKKIKMQNYGPHIFHSMHGWDWNEKGMIFKKKKKMEKYLLLSFIVKSCLMIYIKIYTFFYSNCNCPSEIFHTKIILDILFIIYYKVLRIKFYYYYILL